jgi:RNA polymerase sigma factor for flagellar operon FliA
MAANATRTSYQAGYSDGERERLIMEHLPQVKWIALRIHESLHDSVSIEDLISTGIIGLIHAVDNFDPAHNAKLKTYAEYRIRGAILDSLRGQAGVPEHRRARLKLIEAAIRKLEHDLLRMPEGEEIAAELGISVEEYHEWLTTVQGVSVNSLDAGPDPEEGTVFANLLADQHTPSPSEQFERSELERLVATAIERMPRIERTILGLYYEQELNLREIARVLKMHHTRVSQLKTQAILRLRANLGRKWPSARMAAV